MLAKNCNLKLRYTGMYHAVSKFSEKIYYRFHLQYSECNETFRLAKKCNLTDFNFFNKVFNI